MKKKKLLENPAVVLLLCAAAAGTIYMNALRPLLGKNRDVINNVSVPAEAPPEAVRNMPVCPADTATLPAAKPHDTASISGLHRIGWYHSMGRNPFVPLDRSLLRSAIFSAADPSGVQVVQPKERGPLAPRNIGSPARTPLIAISRGASGRVALIGSEIVRVGDTCAAGIVGSIGPSSITVHTPRGQRTLRLPHISQGAVQ